MNALAERLRCGWEKLDDLLAEPNIQDLILAYWGELAQVKEAAPLDVDWEWMRQREAADQLRIWGVRVESTLAGFIVFQIFPHYATRSTLFAFDAGHFLHPAFRDNGRIGYRMWRQALGALKERGVKVVMAHDNSTRPLLPFFMALGFEPRTTMFWKVL